MQYRLESIKKHHDRKSFDCGNPALNQFLQTTARKTDERQLSKTFVACDLNNPSTIIGFLTLSTLSILVPPSHPYYTNYPHPLPGTKLARMGVDHRYQGQDLGSQLIVHSIQKTVTIAEQVGIIGLFVDPKTPSLMDYYEKFGFEKVDPLGDTLAMWIPLADCRETVEKIPVFWNDEE